eukprot:scaffold7512_cov98-Skeletonema_dohrnii-CCMP3373.AAC.6
MGTRVELTLINPKVTLRCWYVQYSNHHRIPRLHTYRRAHITDHHGIIARCIIIIVAAADTPSLSVLSSVCLLYDY